MAVSYYKDIEKVCISGERYSSDTTKGEMKKRGVDKETCDTVNNNVTEITVVNYYETSGEKEYGMSVVLDCLLDSGNRVRTVVNGMTYLSWVNAHTTVNGKTEGDFVFLFKGVVEELAVRNSTSHKNFIKDYELQEQKKKESSELEIKPGDIVNIHGDVIYLGEFYYYKPNLKVEGLLNKLKKYKMYMANPDKDNRYRSSLIHLETSKTKQNQVTEVLGHVDIDMGDLKEWAINHVMNMEQKDIGFKIKERNNYSYGSLHQAFEDVNNKAYVLANMAENKLDVMKPAEEDILRLGWLCGWDIGKGLLVGFKNKYRDVSLKKPRVYDYVSTTEG